ncbi:ciao1b, partial [Symbiodinium sp. CCMP2592]
IVKTLRAGCKDGFGAVAWSPDCSRVAAAGADNDARVYLLSASEYRQWEAPSLLKGHSDVVRAVSWSPCGRKVLTGGDDKKAIIWKASRSDPKAWEQFSELDQHSDAVRAVAWCPNADKATIATGSEDSTIIIWQPAKESGGDRRKFEV